MSPESPSGRDEESGEDKRETAGEEEAYDVLEDRIRFDSTIVGVSKGDRVVPLSTEYPVGL